MHRLLTAFLDQLFPPRDTEVLVRKCQSAPLPKSHHIHESIICLCDYADSSVSACLVEVKFYRNTYAATLLAKLVDEYLEQKDDFWVIPIPLSKKRLATRGHNQVASVLSKSKYSHLTQTDCLLRTRDTTPQMSLSRTERLRNVTDAFAVNEQFDFSVCPATIFVLDDVCTTGATLKAARASLAPHLPAHTILVPIALAHARS